MFDNEVVQGTYIFASERNLEVCLMPFVLLFIMRFSQVLQVQHFFVDVVVIFYCSDQLESFLDVGAIDKLVFVENLLDFGDLQDLLFVAMEFGL